MDHLLKLLKSNPVYGIPSISIAQTGGSTRYALTGSSNSVPWIIDSRASDHITGLSNFFKSYSSCSSLEKIRVADSSYSLIAGKGLVKLSYFFDLKYVHVPKLGCNLLLASKLT